MACVQVYEGEQADVSVGGVAYLDRGFSYELRYRSITFYTARYELRTVGGGGGGGFAHVPVPDDANIGTFADQLLITLRSAWLGHPSGAMLAAPIPQFMAAADDAARAALLTPLFTPSDTCSLEASAETRSYLVPRHASITHDPPMHVRSACTECICTCAASHVCGVRTGRACRCSRASTMS